MNCIKQDTTPEPKVNMILTNLTEEKMAKILKIVHEEKIHYVFNKDYYVDKHYDIIGFVDKMLKSKNKIPTEFKKIIDDIYLRHLEEEYDEEGLEKIADIEYV